MNILHHKSWHVRNRNNIQRVRRDEEKARKDELEIERRKALVDSEKRVDLLRQIGGKSGVNEAIDVDLNDPKSVALRHIDIFEDFCDKIQTTNKDHEKEVKEEKETFETKTGILQYLVQKDKDLDNNWYLDSHEKRMNLLDKKRVENEKDIKDQKTKKMNDPIEDMKKYLDQMRGRNEEKTSKHKTRKIEFVKSGKSLDQMKKSKKNKKHKKKKRKRHSSESSDDNRVVKVSKSIEQLRAERIERERREKERTRELLTGRKETTTDSVIIDDRLRKYNSQFNPEIARQNSDYK